MTFEGSDVDGLDRVAQECQTAAEVVDTVKKVCEAIVAAASIFGPFGAAFIAYLKTVVIPWLTKITEALQLFGKVLAMRSAMQRDASSAGTSLPTYTTPGDLPTADANNYPVMSTTAPSGKTSGSTLFGLVHYTLDGNHDLTDITFGPSADWGSDTTHFHLDYSRAGDISAVRSDSDVRLGSTGDALFHATSDSDGDYSVTLGTPHLTNDADGSVTPTYDANGQLSEVRAEGHDNLSLNGIPLLRVSGDYESQYHYDTTGALDGMRVDAGGRLLLGPGDPAPEKPADLPGGVRLSETPSSESTGVAFRPAQADLHLSEWFGSYGWGVAGSGDAHTPELTGGLGGGESGGEGLSGGVNSALGADASGQFFLGTLHQTVNGRPDDISGAALGGDAWAGYKIEAGGAYNGADSGGNLSVGMSPDIGGGASAYLLQRNGIDYIGGSGEIDPVSVSGGLHGPDAPVVPGSAPKTGR